MKVLIILCFAVSAFAVENALRELLNSPIKKLLDFMEHLKPKKTYTLEEARTLLGSDFSAQTQSS